MQASWPDVAGPAVAKHTRPGRLERNTLVVFVDSSAWLNDLLRYGQKLILEKLQKKFGADKISAVRFLLDPGR